jgi:hypothetical protein
MTDDREMTNELNTRRWLVNPILLNPPIAETAETAETSHEIG